MQHFNKYNFILNFQKVISITNAIRNGKIGFIRIEKRLKNYLRSPLLPHAVNIYLIINHIKMKNQRNPQINSSKIPSPKKLTNFVKALSRNEEDVYQYILMMVRGDFKSQQNSCDCIFSHLRNIIKNEMNTNNLKYASRFITTLMLLGNIHIYERFIVYLLPIFKDKIIDDYKQNLKPVWPIQLFCMQILYIMAMWLPNDFFDESQPSIFLKVIKQLNIRCDQFKFMTVDKIIISYRIIKALGLDEVEQNCDCQGCKLRKVYKVQTKDDMTNKHMRQKLYILQSKSNIKDNIFQTGFQISLQEEMSQLQNMIENKFKSYNSRSHQQQQSIIFYRLRQKMEILQDNIQVVKGKYHQEGGSDKHLDNINGEDQLKQTANFHTPTKKRQLNEQLLTTDNSNKKSKRYISPTTNIQFVKSMPNIEMLLLDEEFVYNGYDFFQKVIKLNGQQLQKFKHSLICFDQKIYLKKSESFTIYCIALAKNNKIKIRTIYEGDEDQISSYSISLHNSKLNFQFNDNKSEFTIRISHFLEPIQLSLQNQQNTQIFLLPLGLIKLLEPQPDSAVQVSKLKFKLGKTIKLDNFFIKSYQYLIQKLSFLEKLMQKARSSKPARLFQNANQKRKFKRRYRLFQTQLLLTIINHQTQYIEIQILCQDKSTHRRNICQLLKQFIYLCSK